MRVGAAMGLVEAAHDGDGDWLSWCQRLHDAAKASIASDVVNVALTRRHEASFELLTWVSTVPGLAEQVAQQIPSISTPELDRFVRYPSYVGTALGFGDDSPGPDLQGFMDMFGARDALGLVAVSDDISLSLGFPHAQRIRILPRDRQLLTHVMLHVEAGLRLRLHPGTELAVLHPDGRLLHAAGAARRDPSARAGLVKHVTGVERSRARRQRQAGGVDAWSALIAGSWSLVERTDSDGARYYVVVETQRSRRLRALSPVQMEAVELSARGLTGKSVAYALGVSAGSVSKALSEAALKLGISSRTALVRLVAQLLGAGPERAPRVPLTSAEQDVLELIRLGWANAQIARARGRSDHTVANQVASLLRKLNVPSRRALAAASASRR